MRSVFLIEWGHGRNFVQAQHNGRIFPRICFVGYSLRDALRKYRQDHGLQYKRMDMIYL